MLKNRPKVSVIVPIYNVEKYLDKCIESLLKQTLKEVEIILVDDESPDNCPEMCDLYVQKYTNVKVVHKKNQGLGLARNSGIEIAEGEFITFIDSDDYISENALEILYLKAVQNHSQAVFYNITFWKNGNEFATRYDVKEETKFLGRENVDDFTLDLVAPLPSFKHDAKYMVSACRAIYSLDVIKANGIRFVSERKVISEDLVFNIDFLNHVDNVTFIPDSFYFYRYNDDSLTHKVDKSRYSRIKYFLDFVRNQLGSYYPEKRFLLNFYRQQFICMRIQMSVAVKVPENGITIDDILKDPYWAEMLNNYPFWKMDIKHALFFFCVKHKIKWPLMLIITKI